MAQEIEVKVKVVTSEAVNNVDALGNAFDATAKDAQDAQKVFAKAGNGVIVEESIAGLKQLKRELKNVAVGSEEFKKLYNDIDDLEDKLKSAKNTSSDWVDSLEQAGGPLGMLGAGINKAKVATQTFGGALKATGIGLIVALLAGLAGAFANNEGAMKKLQPLLDGVSKLFQGVFRAVEPLFNTLVDLAISALPMVSKAFSIVYSTMTATLQSFGAIGAAIGKLIKGDFSGAWETAKSSVNDFGKNYDASLKRFSDGSKELTKGEKEQADKREEDRKAAQTKREEEEQKARDKRAEERAKELEALRAYNEETNKLIGEFTKVKIETQTQDYLDEQERKRKSLEDISAMVDAIDAEDLVKAKALSDEKLKIAEAESQQKKDIQEAQFALASGAISFLKQIGEKNKAIQKAAIIAENAIGIGKMIIANNAANIGALATPQAILTSGASAIPVIAMNNITTALGVATTIASTAKALSAVGGGGVGSAPAIGGGISAPATVQASPSVVAPSGVNQLASTLGQNVPIKAYVVSKDMTTQQSLDRNITDTASIG